MIVKVQVRSKSNLQVSTPQSKKTPSTISLKFNSWLTRFNLHPKVEEDSEKKENFSQPSEKKLELNIGRDSKRTEDRVRPHSKPVNKNTTLTFSPKKTPSRPSVKNENVVRMPSQLISKVQPKVDKPKSPSRSEPLSEYTIGNTLGSGSYGVVKYGVHKVTDRKVAIKIYDKSKMTDINQQKSVQTEIKILLKLDHPNIVKLYQHIDTQQSLYIILEYISGYSLSASLKRKPNRRLEEFEANRYFHELLLALDYCHSRGITHRDIKLENTLIDNANKRVKLIDFGFATCFSNAKKVKMFCGTPNYMAPEIVSRKEYLGPPVDIWAAGVLLYVLLTGSFPFKGSSDGELYKSILRGNVVFPDYLSIAAKQLILKMLANDPAKRPRASDLLKDPWFRSSFSISTTLASKPERFSEYPAVKIDNSPKFKVFSSSFNSLDLHICSAGETVLQVTPKASKCQIRSSYLELAKSHHPDQSGSNEMFQKIKTAYETLADDEKRYDYDLEQGYLNAIDIDQMENNLKIYGTRYVAEDLKQTIENLSNENPQKPKLSEHSEISELTYLRARFFLSLILGFPVSYSLSLYILETFIYPVSENIPTQMMRLSKKPEKSLNLKETQDAQV